ncbi:MAG: group III truncated hemoglobin [Rhodanobacteraceae bacterium]|jgi:hemoglobin|nr:group III truncated hemoglobin [Rhodanobacteraceae bacterium]
MTTPAPLDEAQIARLVDRFYDKVRADLVLGAVFNPVVEDWDAHKRLLTAFWCSVVLRSGTYQGNPMGKHRGHSIHGGHFERWLALWRETTHELLDAESAATMYAYAQRIGRGLQLGLGLADAGAARALGIRIIGQGATG